MAAHGSIEKMLEDESTLLLLDRQYFTYTALPRFKKAYDSMSTHIHTKSDQMFYNEGRLVREQVMTELGYETSRASAKLGSKQQLADDLAKILPRLETPDEYKVLDREKGRFALRVGDSDYEVGTVLHKKKQYEETGEVFMAQNTRPYAVEVSDALIALEYDVIGVKNNLVTVLLETGEQISVRITKKRDRLF